MACFLQTLHLWCCACGCMQTGLGLVHLASCAFGGMADLCEDITGARRFFALVVAPTRRYADLCLALHLVLRFWLLSGMQILLALGLLRLRRKANLWKDLEEARGLVAWSTQHPLARCHGTCSCSAWTSQLGAIFGCSDTNSGAFCTLALKLYENREA